LEEIPDFSSSRDREIVAIDDALKTLAGMDPRKARVVELRFFGGRGLSLINLNAENAYRVVITARK
jgi:hypothetical protein